MSQPRAAYQTAHEDGRVRCRLCPRGCQLGEGEVGDCRTRRVRDGVLEVTTYGRLQAAAVDPVEKKPLFHFRPGTGTFSVAASGCNLVCPFCQNHGLSQLGDCPDAAASAGRRWTPEQVVSLARENGAASISFTYSEPILQIEFARDVAGAAAGAGLDLVFVTNGQINREPVSDLAGWLGAANVDLKSFRSKAYKEVLGGRLQSTLFAISTLVNAGVWVEITTLVIPGFNDSDEELREIARFIRSVGADVPWHVSRFHPAYHWLDRVPTPVDTLRRARQIGLSEGLRYVYTGNVPGDDGESTNCPRCAQTVIRRLGYRIDETRTQGGRCSGCGETIAGVGIP